MISIEDLLRSPTLNANKTKRNILSKSCVPSSESSSGVEVVETSVSNTTVMETDTNEVGNSECVYSQYDRLL